MSQKDLEVWAFIANFDLTVEDTSLDNAKLKKALFCFALFSLIRIFATEITKRHDEANDHSK